MLIMLLTLGVGQMWAWTFNWPYLYFNNSNDWSDVMMLMYYHGSDEGTQGFDLEQITNTKLWYCRASENRGTTLSGFTYGFGEVSGAWGWESQSSEKWDDRWKYLCDNYSHTGTSQTDLGPNTYYITSSGSSNLSVTKVADGEAHGSITKYNATQAAKKRDSGTTYSDVTGSWPASLKLQGTYLSGAGTSGQSTITSTTSTDGDDKKVYGAVVTGLITHSYESLSSDYYFEGWGTGSNPSVTTATHSYNISTATTTYAFFSKLYTLNFDVKGTPGTSTMAVDVANYVSVSTGDKVPTGHTITATATIASGYEVEGWYSDASCTSAYTNGSGGVTISGIGNKNFSITSLNSNSGIYSKFVALQTVSVESNGAGGTVSTASVKAGASTASATITATPANIAWRFKEWNIPSGVTIASGSATSTSITIYATAGSKTVTAVFEPRYGLVGSRQDGTTADGMPLWTDANSADFVVTSFTDKDHMSMTCTRTLLANKDYKFQVYDRESNCRRGGNNDATMTLGSNWKLTGSGNVLFNTKGAGTYTFEITAIDNSNYQPSIQINAVTSYTVTYGHGTGGSTVSAEGSVSGTVATTKYVAAGEDVTFTQSAASGYTFKEWNTQADGNGTPLGTGASLTLSSIGENKNVYAIYTPNTYTVTFDINGGDTWANNGTASVSGGGVRSMTMTYDASVSGTCPTPVKNGYVFKCWSTDPDLWEGKYLWQYDGSSFGWYYPVAYADYISTAGKWKKASDVTLYAHYYPVSIMAVDFSPRHVVPEGEVTATVRFNPFLEGSAPTYNPEGDYTMCYTLTTSAGTALQAQPTWDQDDAALTVTFTAPGSPGEYTLDVKLLAGIGTDCDETPIEDYQAAAPYTFEVEEMNSVTVSFKCGSADVAASTTARATWSNPATVTAPTIPGLQFVNWTYTGGVSLVDGYENTDNPVQIKAISSGTLTANYSQGPLFFKNTLGWDHVYIYFYDTDGYLYSNPSASEGTGSSTDWEDTNDNKHKPFISGPLEMSLLEGTTDVYYFDEEVNGTMPDFAAVAFTAESMPNYGYFAGTVGEPCHVVRVAHSINSAKPMIVPVGSGAKWNLNKAWYYGHDEAPILTDWGYNLRGAFNEWSSSKSEFKAPTLGSLTFTTTAYLDAGNANYAWKVYNGNKGYGKGGDPVLTKSSPTSATLISADAAGNNLQVKSNIAGEYTFTLNYGIGTGTANTNGASLASTLLSNMTVTVTYPVVAGDYRLIYTGGTNPHPGNVIKKRADGEDIVSMYVASGKADKIKIHACTATDNTSVTWGSTSDPTYGTDVYSAFTTLLSKEGSGVYNFYITQDASGNPKITNVEKYTGRFYVRTNCANDDKWNYKDSKDAHAMTYSEWSEKKMEDTDMRFSHYYVDDLHGTVGSPINIRFTVATDYSDAICDTVFAGDADGKWKDYIHSESLQRTANVRFTYDQNRNKIWRAYTEGPENNDYMVLRSNGSDVFVVNGLGGKGDASAAVKFTDLNNWVYQADVFANVNSYIKLTADIAGVRQYLRGNTSDSDFDEDDAEMLIGGSESGLSAQHMRITYDFKTDRMTTSWIPSAAVSGTLDIHADIMLLRTHQDGASSITFNTGGKLTDVKTAYGVMEFQKNYINDYSLSRYERNLYWISFPFDVNLSDVFGFGNYGEHWIIEYYDGKGRAEKGYWAESEPNWKFVTEEVKDEFVLKANEGYILALALSNMTEYSDIWANSVTSVYLYFPSANTIGNLSNVSSVTVEMDTVGYKCKITRDNRHIKDSYWRCIGVPSYALSTRTGLPTSAPDNWETKVPYVYIWNSINNSLAITSSSSVTFEAMHSYLIQYPDDKMVWTNVTNVPAGVMRRRVEGREAPFYEWNLNLLYNGEHKDHTYVRLTNDENATDGYDFGNDLSKEFNSGSNIYTFVDDIEVAGNVKPFSNQTTVVQVGVKIAADGEYTFAMPEGTNGVSAVLIDNIAGTRTNLALDEYTVSLESGTINGRFFLEISPIANTPTDVDNVQSDNVQGTVRKVMVDGIMYIVKDGKVFDAQGNRVR